MRGYRLLLALTGFMSGSMVAALFVYAALPSPSDAIELLAFIGMLFVLCLTGPIIYAWAWGPGPMSGVATSLAIALPLLSGMALHFGFFRAGSLKWLIGAVLIWAGFGGYSAYVAVSGSI